MSPGQHVDPWAIAKELETENARLDSELHAMFGVDRENTRLRREVVWLRGLLILIAVVLWAVIGFALYFNARNGG